MKKRYLNIHVPETTGNRLHYLAQTNNTSAPKMLDTLLDMAEVTGMSTLPHPDGAQVVPVLEMKQ